jgi:hypothetical protein
MPKWRRLMVALGAAVLIGAGGPALDVAVKCQRSRARIAAACPGPEVERLQPCPASTEACVWGRALLPVSIGAGLLLIGLPVAWLVYWWTGRKRSVAAAGV